MVSSVDLFNYQGYFKYALWANCFILMGMCEGVENIKGVWGRNLGLVGLTRILVNSYLASIVLTKEFENRWWGLKLCSIWKYVVSNLISFKNYQLCQFLTVKIMSGIKCIPFRLLIEYSYDVINHTWRLWFQRRNRDRFDL